MYDDDTLEFIRVGCDIKLSKELSIESNKIYSGLKKQAINSVKTDYCKICGCHCDSFCNSHTIPAFVLSNIANDGKLYRSSKITNLEPLHEKYGIKEINTFKLICRECDSTFFQNYESETSLSQPVDELLLNEIALKNYLNEYYVKSVDIGMFSGLSKMNPQALTQIEPSKIDADDAEENITKILKAIKSKKGLYFKFFEIDLDYVVPIAFQSKIVLVSGFDGIMINNIYNFDKNYKLKDIHLCVFPLKDKTKIIFFVDKEDKRYRKFRKQFSKLSVEERLEIINYIMFLYCDEIYMSTKISSDILQDSNFKEVTSMTSNYRYCSNEPPNMLEISKKANYKYDLSNRIKIPNLLSKEFAI